MPEENRLGKQDLKGHMARIRNSYPGILPRQADYAAIGPVYIGGIKRMKQLAAGKIDGTWEKSSLARGLATNIIEETRRVLQDIDLKDEKTAEEITNIANRFYVDEDFRRGHEGSIIAAGVARTTMLGLKKRRK
jgi:hypothetical protein